MRPYTSSNPRGRFEAALSEERENKTAALLQLKDYYNNTVSILETDLLEAKVQEEDAKQVPFHSLFSPSWPVTDTFYCDLLCLNPMPSYEL